MIRIPSFIALALALLAAGPVLAQGAIEIHDARARASIGSGQTSAVYLTVHNHGTEADRLVGVASAVARSTGLHTTLHEQGIMKMRPLDGLDLPAGGAAEFMPGGHHIMLVGLGAPLTAGDRFPLTLRFEKAGEIEADVAVVAPGDIQGHGGHGMQQGTQ